MASDDSFEQPQSAPRRLPRAALVLVALVLAGVIGLVVRPGSDGSGELAVDDDEPAPTPERPEPPPEPSPEPDPADDGPGADAELHEAGGAWTDRSEAPLSPRRVAPAWTGSELVVWGGQGDGMVQRPFHDDGAAYDPATDEWRELPPSPLGARGGHVAVWADGQLLVWGGQGRVRFHDDGAAYDPDTDSWTTIPPGPLSPRADAVAAWLGGELVVAGGLDGAGYLTDAAAYDPDRQQWRTLRNDLPVGVSVAEARATVLDGRFVLWSPGGPGPDASLFRYYDPGDDRWGHIEPPGILSDVQPDQWITATDDALVAVSAQGPGGRPRMAVNRGQGWEDVVAPQGSRGPPGSRMHPFSRAAVADGDRVYVLDDVHEPLRYDLASGTWSALPGIEAAGAHHTGEHYQAVSLGDGVLVWLGGVAEADAAATDASPPGVVLWRPQD